MGIAAAGYIDERRATVLFAPNLAWRDEPLKATIEDAVGIPVVVENDANAAAWGEFRFGAGADVDELLMVALGTGIGGGIVLRGELFRGTLRHRRRVRAREDGARTGRVCGCGNRGCWEQYASGKALVREVREVAATRSPTAAATSSTPPAATPTAITGPMVTAAAQGGRPALHRGVRRRSAAGSGEGLADLASIFDPGVIIIGGGVSEAGDLLDRSRRWMPTGASSSGRGHRPEMEIRLARSATPPACPGSATGRCR